MKQIRLTVEFSLPELLSEGEESKLKYEKLDVSTFGVKGEKEVKLLNNEVESLDTFIRKRHPNS